MPGGIPFVYKVSYNILLAHRLLISVLLSHLGILTFCILKTLPV